jgi:nucleoside-diphosphate-sugar epimerase
MNTRIEKQVDVLAFFDERISRALIYDQSCLAHRQGVAELREARAAVQELIDSNRDMETQVSDLTDERDGLQADVVALTAAARSVTRSARDTGYDDQTLDGALAVLRAALARVSGEGA